MSTPIRIKLRPEDEQLLRDLQSWPKELPARIARALDRQNDLTVTYTQRTYLSYPKHGPTMLMGLRVQSNRLRGSLRAAKSVISGTNVASSIGTNVKYARLHEFGGSFTRTQKPGIVRLRTDRTGALLRQGANGQLAIFAGKHHKAVKEVAHQGSTYTVIYPERMPVRRGIADQQGAYTAAVSAAVKFSTGGAK